MVGQALDYCRVLGLTSVMITCGDENEASWRLIEHFKGRLQDRVWDDEDNDTFRRYWIELG